MSKDYGEDIAAWAAHVNRIAQQLGDIEKINEAGQDNPAYQIVMMTARQALPFYKDVSPEDTGLLKQSHIIGDSGISQGSGFVEAFAEITIDQNTQENVKYGGYPRDYGPEYHQEKRPWFLEAQSPVLALFDQIVDEQFSIWVHTVSF